MHVCKTGKCKVNGTYRNHLLISKKSTTNESYRREQDKSQLNVVELFAGLSWLG